MKKLFSDEVLLQYDHLKNLMPYINNNDDYYNNNCGNNNSKYEDQPVFKITKDIFKNPLLLTNPLLIMLLLQLLLLLLSL